MRQARQDNGWRRWRRSAAYPPGRDGDGSWRRQPSHPWSPAPHRSFVGPPPLLVTYNLEISRLRAVLDQRRGTLDSATVAIVEQSLTTIDRAIANARAALARDSASLFLSDQLSRALEKKLGVLRTVALLPARAL